MIKLKGLFNSFSPLAAGDGVLAKDTISGHQWIERVERAIAATEWNEAQTMLFVASSLRGPAKLNQTNTECLKNTYPRQRRCKSKTCDSSFLNYWVKYPFENNAEENQTGKNIRLILKVHLKIFHFQVPFLFVITLFSKKLADCFVFNRTKM